MAQRAPPGGDPQVAPALAPGPAVVALTVLAHCMAWTKLKGMAEAVLGHVKGKRNPAVDSRGRDLGNTANDVRAEALSIYFLFGIRVSRRLRL